MATASLVAMGVFTGAMFFVDLERVKALADISNLFYITGGGIVAAYMGASAFMNRK
jgi:aldehyde:ferredoxin oxidoreductase